MLIRTFNIIFIPFFCGIKPILSSFYSSGCRPMQGPFFSICLPSPGCHRLAEKHFVSGHSSVANLCHKDRCVLAPVFSLGSELGQDNLISEA